MTHRCVACEAPLAEAARFCAACGARQPEEDAAGVLAYRDALVALAGRTEAWAEAELAALRRELHIRPATHARLLAEIAAPKAEAPPVSLWLDAATLATMRVGEQGLVRLRVCNEGGRALGGVSVRVTTTAAPEAVEASGRGVLGPGEEEVLGLVVRPAVAGHHPLTGTLAVTPLRGEPRRYTFSEPFRVGAAAALQQSIHIDARSQRVGIFENIGGAERGGLVAHADWRPVALSAGAAPSEAPAPTLPPVGHRGPGVVVAVGAEVTVAIGGAEGRLVELDPALRAVIGPGDKLQVTVLGHDGRGGLILSAGPSSGAPAAASGPTTAEHGPVRHVGPGDPLADLLRDAPAGARFVVTGTHRGPFVVDRPVELSGDAVLTAARGPVLRLAADAVVRGLTIRGDAPAGAYAVDAVEIAAGRCRLEGCTLSSDQAGNLTPGRAVVVGAARVEVHGCTIRHSGIGVAVDVSWSGFATDTAAGARVTVTETRFEELGTGVAIAGAGRQGHVARCVFARVADGAVRLLRGAAATVEDSTLPPGALHAEPGADLSSRGNHP